MTLVRKHSNNASVESGATPLIFISHARGQVERAQKLESSIRNHFGNRVHTWLDAYHMVGDPLQAMGEYVRKATLVILCVSSTYEKSEYCMAEAGMAMELKKKRLVLIMEANYDPTKNPKLHSIISGPMRINCCNDQELEGSQGKIFKEIEKHICQGSEHLT